MHVAKDVQTRLYPKDGSGELLATQVFARNVVFVHHFERRAVGDEDIGSVWHLVPVFPACGSPFDSGCHVAENRRNWTAPDIQTFHRDAGVFEVCGVGERGAGSFGVRLKKHVVIAGNNDAVPVRQVAEPAVEVFYFFDGASLGHEISRMNQDVTVWDCKVPMITVRVTDADNFEAAGRALIVCYRVCS